MRNRIHIDPADLTYVCNHNGFMLFYRGLSIGGEHSAGGVLTSDGLPGELRDESVNPNVSEHWAKIMINHLTSGWIPLYMAERIRQINEEKDSK